LWVSPGLDWRQNDRIVVFPTAMQPDHFDYAVIEHYDHETGNITLVEPLDYYHWGQSYSTIEQYSGVDMRAEVVLLTRNVKIAGNDTDSWGG